MENIENREDRGSSVSAEKKRAFQLCSFAQDYFLEQYTDTYTRGKNFLDLMFCSDSNYVTHNIPLDNVIISDHTLCVIGTNMNISTNKPTEVRNIYSTEICNYNLMSATKEERNLLNDYYLNIDWNIVLNSDDIDKNCDKLIDILEMGVKRCMRRIVNEKTTKNASGNTFKSSNLIPKEIRTLFKRKGKLSKSYRKVKTIN